MILAVVVVVLVAIGVGVALFFNWLSPRVDAHRRAHDDNYFFNSCRSGVMTRYRWLNRRFPADPRCRLCLVPFGGVGRLLRISPSRKNPNFCMGCFEMAPLGAYDMEVGVLFADIRGFTSWCEGQLPVVIERALNSFYAVSTAVLAERDAIIDKLVGDEVMGLFLTAFPPLESNACSVMVGCAEEILRRLERTDPVLPVGIGLNFGLARVGNVGGGSVKDFTAIGDAVNTANRLQAEAHAGEIVMSGSVYEQVKDHYPRVSEETLSVKGKAEHVRAYRVRGTDRIPTPSRQHIDATTT